METTESTVVWSRNTLKPHLISFPISCFVLLVWLQLTGGACLAQIQFQDVSDQTGIDYLHNDGGFGERYIVEYTSAGLAVFDFDDDGLLDLYFLNGGSLGGESEPGPNRLFRNLGDFRFTDVTEHRTNR